MNHPVGMNKVCVSASYDISFKMLENYGVQVSMQGTP